MMNEDEFLKLLIFDKYITDKKIGEGSFGKVYTGRNKLTKEKVAIKMVKSLKLINMKIIF